MVSPKLGSNTDKKVVNECLCFNSFEQNGRLDLGGLPTGPANRFERLTLLREGVVRMSGFPRNCSNLSRWAIRSLTAAVTWPSLSTAPVG